MKLFRRLHKDQKGLTLIELMMVAAILAVLATITAGAVSGTTGKSRASTKSTDLNEVQKAVDRFVADDVNSKNPVDTTSGEVWALTLNDDGTIDTATKVATPALGSDGLPTTTGQYIQLNFTAETTPGSGETAKTFVPDELARSPRHASDTITVPASLTDTTVPVWLIGKDGLVINVWPPETY